MNRVISGVAVILMLQFSAATQAALFESDFERTIESCFGKGFIPTPWGADARYAVKNLWTYGKVQRADGTSSTQSVWDVSGDGEYYFPTLPIKEARRSKCLAASSSNWKLGLAIKIKEATTTDERQTLDAALQALIARNLGLVIETPPIVVNYVYGFDLDTAIYASKDRLNRAFTAHETLWGASPTWRVVTSAIIAQPGRIVMRTASNAKIELSGMEASLGNAGFELSTAKDGYITLDIDEPAYVAYIARVKKGSLPASYSSAATVVVDTYTRPEDTRKPEERFPWER